MLKKQFIVLAFFLGLISGIVGSELSLPALSTYNNVYYHGTRGKNQVAITINVDWGEEYLPSILNILESKQVKASFFLTGKWAQKNPELVKAIASSGHEIGNHGYSHQHPKNLSREGLINLIKQNEEIIYQICGLRTNLFAPPYGEVDNRIASIVESIGYKTIMWSADTIDWQRPAAEIIVQRALNKIDDGGIILMHPTKPTTQALAEIITKIQKRGFKFVTVSQLIKE